MQRIKARCLLRTVPTVMALFCISYDLLAQNARLAPTPPMGWNSYDSYCGDVTEEEVKRNTDYMAQHLTRLGWKYVVVDFYWYYPHPVADSRHEGDLDVAMDDHGRLLPATNRFPTAANGKGFKTLAGYVHSQGLKFGIHIMRGIPRQAVKLNLPVLGTGAHAQDIANLNDPCSWSTAMCGVDTSKPAGQAYYDSIAQLYAQWGVDYIKADDMCWAASPPAAHSYHGDEIEALSRAIAKSARPMVLSLSPDRTEVVHAEQSCATPSFGGFRTTSGTIGSNCGRRSRSAAFGLLTSDRITGRMQICFPWGGFAYAVTKMVNATHA